MRNTLLNGIKKTISILLITSMISNISIDLLAQTTSLPKLKNPKKQDVLQQYLNTLSTNPFPTGSKENELYSKKSLELNSEANQRFKDCSPCTLNVVKQQHVELPLNLYKGTLNDPITGKAEIIKHLLTTPAPKIVKEEKTLNKAEFAAEFKKDIDTQAQQMLQNAKKQYERYQRDVKKEAKNYADIYTAQEVEAWASEQNASLETWFKDVQQQVKLIQTNEKKLANKKYEEYKKHIAQAEEEANHEAFRYLKDIAQELMTLYAKDKQKMERYLVELTPMLLMVTYKGERLFSKTENATLRNLYRKTLANSKSCTEYASCAPHLNSLAGLGIVGDADDLMPINSFINSHLQHAESVKIISTGISALAALKAYGEINGIINGVATKDRKLEDIDLLSVGTYVTAAANKDGQYLGNISKYNQYVMDNNVKNNVWFDVALILARDGSPKALDILRKQGVEKCTVKFERELDFTSNAYINCNSALMPFLVGALVSKKSGADKYNKQPVITNTHNLIASGKTVVYTHQDLANSKIEAQNYTNNFFYYAKKMGVTPAEAVAAHIINRDFGDIDAKQEEYIDTQLDNIYGVRLKNKYNSYAVIDSAKLKAKESRVSNFDSWRTFASVADVGILVWCAWDITKLGTKGVRGIYKFMGPNMYHTIRIARLGKESTTSGYLLKNMTYGRYLVNKRTALAKASTRIKNGISAPVLEDIKKFTSAKLPIEFVPPAPNSTMQNVFKTARFTAETGKLAVDAKKAYRLSQDNPGRVLDIIKAKNEIMPALNSSIQNTQLGRPKALARLAPKTVFKSSLVKGGKEFIYGADYLTAFEKGSAIDMLANVKITKDIKTFIASLKQAEEGFTAAQVNTRFMKDKKSLILFRKAEDGTPEQVESVRIFLEGSIPGVNRTLFRHSKKKTADLASVYLTDAKRGESGTFLKFIKSDNRGIDADFFKIKLNKESVSDILKFANQTTLKEPFVLKLVPEYSGAQKAAQMVKFEVPSFFKGKKHLTSQEMPVFFKNASGVEEASNIKVLADGRFKGGKLILNSDNSVSIFNAYGKQFNNNFGLYLPKAQLDNFMEIAGAANKVNKDLNLNLTLTGSKNKINPLFFTTAISLSAASSGLVGPLENTFKTDDSTITMITIGFPYAASAASPLFAPLVKRYGAANMLKASSLIALGALSIPTAYGYNGFGNIYAGNPDNPSVTPLLASASLVGVSAALTRSSINPLMDAIGGGGNFLKSMVFKNFSSFAMIAPPLIFNSFGKDRTNKDGTPLLDENNKPVRFTDFALSYPVLAAVTGSSLVWLQKSKLPNTIGRIEEIKGTTKTQTLKNMSADAWKSVKTVGHKEVVAPMIGGTLVVGAESALVNKYSNSTANIYVDEVMDVGSDVRPIIATSALITAPLIVRWNSKKIISALGGEANPAAYSRLLAGSLATAGTGTALLMTQDSPATFAGGMALTAAGFASTTQGIQKLGQLNLKNKLAMVTELNKAGRFSSEFAKGGELSKNLKSAATIDKSFIEGYNVMYPGIHVGMAFIPLIPANIVKEQTSESDSKIEKNKVFQQNLWAPAAALGIGSMFVGKNMLNASKTTRMLTDVKAGKSLQQFNQGAQYRTAAALGIGLTLPQKTKAMLEETYEPQFYKAQDFGFLEQHLKPADYVDMPKLDVTTAPYNKNMPEDAARK
ncbi:hypothetical protein AAIR98_001263 [Elusimicrobium simillimum]|uniref:MFS transporter n=1 Tax=Elusimicrobium simillimum TaxID=3143438 RepID=UPI003C702128